jgi:serine/threonine protein kinase/WD40 repeat protein
MDPTMSDRDPVDELAEEFVRRYRCGERPSLQEYTDRFPQWADRIRALFPTLVVLEKARPDSGCGAEADGDRVAADARPERLGDYRIIREVGRGGMGVVYEAEQESLGRHVALKVLPRHALLDPRHLQRFRREARAAARLHHTNIVPVHGVGEQDGLHYYVMQFIPGQGLDQVLAELRRLRRDRRTAASAEPSEPGSAAAAARSLLNGPLPVGDADGADPTLAKGQGAAANSPAHPRDGKGTNGAHSGVHLPGQSEGSSLSGVGWQYWRSVSRIGLQVADALAYASSQGVLHRDIKPSNLLLDTRGTVWVTDFGLAKAETDTDNVTQTGDVVGTLRYMAPERFRGLADVRTDLYALGLTLYELLTLRPAFDEIDRNKLIAQVIDDEPVRPRKVDAAVPRDLETIVLKATARDPAHRYQTPAELAEDLQRFLDDRPIRARRMGPLQRGWRWCRRNPVAGSLAGAVVILLAVVAIVSSVAWWRLSAEQGKTLNELQRAEKAERAANDRLWDSDLTQAQARRWSGKPGRHFLSLEALREAALIRTSPQLRNEAVACIPLVDLRVARRWRREEIPFSRIDRVAWDARLERFAAESDPKGTISIRRVADGSEIVRLAGPGIPAPHIQFSPDGQYLAARYDKNGDGNRGSECCVWALARSECILRIAMPTGVSGHAAQVFLPEKGQFVIGLGDRSLRVYDLASGQELKKYTLEAAASWLALHPDGRKLAVSTWFQRTIQVLDLETGQESQLFRRRETIGEVSWHPSGKMLAGACSDKNVYVWNIDDAEQPHAVLAGHQNASERCAFNHRGDLLASYGLDGTTRLWDPIGGKELVNISGGFIGFSPDDRFLAYGRQTEVGIWEVAAGRECRSLYALGQQTHGPWTVDCQRGGRLLASSNDEGVRLWDVATGKEIGALPAGKSRAVLFAPSGDWLLTSGELGIHRWPIRADAPGGPLRFGPPQSIREPSMVREDACLSANGRWLAAMAGPGQAIVLDLEKPGEAVVLDGHPNVSEIALSPDGRWAVTGAQHGSGIKVWDARAGKVVRDLPAGPAGGSIFSPDGKWLVTTSLVEGTHIREVDSWNVRHNLSKERSGGLAISRDSRLLAVSYENGTVTLIDLVKGKELTRLPSPNPLPIGGMCFSDDGSQLAVSCYNHQTIQLWDLRAIRARLKDMNLNWEQPDYPSPAAVGPAPLRVEVIPGDLAAPAPPK